MNDYKNIIFDENQFFDSYEKKDFIKKTERLNFVKFWALVAKSIIQLNENDKNWLNFPIRKRLNEVTQMQFKRVIENSTDEKNDQPLIFKQSATPKQLNTLDDTFFIIFGQDNVFYFSRFIGDDRTFWFAFDSDKNSNAVNNQNVIQWKKRAKPKTTSKNMIFEKILKTDQIFLKMTDFKLKKIKLSANVKKFNIIKKKNSNF